MFMIGNIHQSFHQIKSDQMEGHYNPEKSSMINTVNVHDENIHGIFYVDKEEVLEFFLSNKKKIRFKEVIYWDLSEFEKQNIIYEIEQYKEIPIWIKDEFGIKKALPLGCFLYYINSSVGLSGIVIAKDANFSDDETS